MPQRLHHWELTISTELSAAAQCAWSPDGSFILAELTNNTLHIWEAGGTFQRRHPDKRWDGELLALSPDGCWVVTGRLASGVGYIWDVVSGKLRREIAGHSGVIVAAAFDPTSTRLVTAFTALEEPIYVWDVETGQLSLTLDLPTNLPSPIENVAFSPNGKLIMSQRPTGDRSPAHISWDASNGALLSIINATIREPSCFSPCSRYVVSISPEGSVAFWRTRDGLCIDEITANGRPVEHIARTPDGMVLCCGCTDGSIFFCYSDNLTQAENFQ